MNLDEMTAEYRERTGDKGDPPMVSDERAAQFASQAEREACRRARLITDSTTAACCQIAVVAGTAVYDLHPKVLFVRQARLAGRSPFLSRMSRKDLDCTGTEWLTETGEVEGYVVDMDSRKIRLFRVPTANGTLHLTVTRLPLENLLRAEDTPEIGEHLHDSLIDWMEHRHYSMRDKDVADDALATAALARFEREFGPAISALEEHWMEENHGFIEDEGLR